MFCHSPKFDVTRTLIGGRLISDSQLSVFVIKWGRSDQEERYVGLHRAHVLWTHRAWIKILSCAPWLKPISTRLTLVHISSLFQICNVGQKQLKCPLSYLEADTVVANIPCAFA